MWMRVWFIIFALLFTFIRANIISSHLSLSLSDQQVNVIRASQANIRAFAGTNVQLDGFMAGRTKGLGAGRRRRQQDSTAKETSADDVIDSILNDTLQSSGGRARPGLRSDTGVVQQVSRSMKSGAAYDKIRANRQQRRATVATEDVDDILASVASRRSSRRTTTTAIGE
mmetsp:Transcript_6787/g.20675  ORF Transcript_6787/g.20675 Transcript_6787/m.20675 type:complete len:170 (-) Transcript_6787:79-588(-)